MHPGFEDQERHFKAAAAKVGLKVGIRKPRGLDISKIRTLGAMDPQKSEVVPGQGSSLTPVPSRAVIEAMCSHGLFF